jgi:excisionase family DNA binding protein
MIHKLIDSTILADYLKSNQALVEEIIRDQKAQEEKSQLSQTSEQMLTAKEAATLLACSEDWLYRNAKKLPFTRKLGPKALRFSKQGISKWLETRNVRH